MQDQKIERNPQPTVLPDVATPGIWAPKLPNRIYATAAPLYRKREWLNPLPVGLVEIGKDATGDPIYRWLKNRKDAPPRGFTGGTGRDVTEEDIAGWRDHKFKGAVNIAVSPSGCIAFDVDGPEGQMVLHEYGERIGFLPATFSSTARGPHSIKRHLFYRVPDGLDVTGAEFALRKRHGVAASDGTTILPLDIIHRTYRYAVVYPSVHPDGGQYLWYGPDRIACTVPHVSELTMLPDPWCDLMRELAGEHTATRTANGKRGEYGLGEREWIDWQARKAIETALSHIRTTPCGDGANYNHELFKRANFLFMFAPELWTEDEAQEAIERALTDRFGAPDRADLKTVASARRSVTSAFTIVADPCDLLPFDDEESF